MSEKILLTPAQAYTIQSRTIELFETVPEQIHDVRSSVREFDTQRLRYLQPELPMHITTESLYAAVKAETGPQLRRAELANGLAVIKFRFEGTLALNTGQEYEFYPDNQLILARETSTQTNLMYE